MKLKEFNVDVEQYEDSFRMFDDNDGTYDILPYVNEVLNKLKIDLEFVNIYPGSSDMMIIPVTGEELRILELTEGMLNPDWDNTQRCHDWKNHVPDSIKTVWATFDEVQVLGLVKGFQDKADDEEWE